LYSTIPLKDDTSNAHMSFMSGERCILNSRLNRSDLTAGSHNTSVVLMQLNLFVNIFYFKTLYEPGIVTLHFF